MSLLAFINRASVKLPATELEWTRKAKPCTLFEVAVCLPTIAERIWEEVPAFAKPNAPL